MEFEKLISAIEDKKYTVYGIEVYKNGTLLYSYGDTDKGLYDIYSATKSIVSIAVGIAYDRGIIDLNASILKYLPKDKVNSMTENQINDFGKITIWRLLTMSVSGFAFRPEGDNYLDYALNTEFENVEKDTFAYSNIPVYLVCVALENIFGQDLGNFIEENILAPLDITKYEYGRSPEGIFYGASQMKLTVNELSRVGMLMMNNGIYNGKQIISKEYAKLATSVQNSHDEDGYGFYFWKYKDGYYISGKWNQKCYCLPGQNLIITYLSHIEEDSDAFLAYLEKFIIEY